MISSVIGIDRSSDDVGNMSLAISVGNGQAVENKNKGCVWEEPT